MRKSFALSLLAVLALTALIPANAFAANEATGLLDSFITQTSGWWSVLRGYALFLFTLTLTIEVCLFGVRMALQSSQINEVMGQFVTLLLFAGFVAAVINNYQAWATGVAITGLKPLVGQLTGNSVDAGQPFAIAAAIVDKVMGVMEDFGITDIVEALLYVNAMIIIIVVFVLISALVIITTCEFYIVANIGVLLIGLGGSKIFKDYAVNVMRYVLSVAVKLFVLQLVVNIGFAMLSLNDLDASIPAYEPQPLEWNPHEKAEAILQNSGATIYHDQRDRAFYRGGEDAIHLPSKASFEVAGEYYSTALHELGHWACAKNRLDIKGGPFGSELYSKEELRVEIASWMICQDLGLDFKPENSAAYIDHWRKALNDDPYEIVRACRDAERIKKHVLGLELEQAESLESQLETLRLHRDERGNAMNANIGFSTEAVNAVLNIDLIDPTSPKAAEQFMASLTDMEKEPALAEDRDFTLTVKRLKSIGQEMEGSGGIAKWREVDECLSRYVESVTKMIPLKFEAENIAAEKIYLDVPYKEKEVAKQLGATWDRDAKQWCARPGADLDKLAKWLPQAEAARAVPDQAKDYQPETTQEKIFLKVPYREKEQAKAFGAKWDKEAKLWFAPEGADLTPLSKWIPEKEPEPTPALNPVEEFGQRLESAGFKLDGPPVMDGRIQRAPVEGGKAGARDGAYCAHADGKPNGWLQNHRTGEHAKWLATGQNLTAEQKTALKVESAARLAERKSAREKAYEEAAGRIFHKLGEAAAREVDPEHPYLKDKGVKAFSLSQDAAGNLMIVGIDLGRTTLPGLASPGAEGPPRSHKDLMPALHVQTLQTITPTGKKHFAPSSKKAGAMHLIGQEQFQKIAFDQWRSTREPLLEKTEPQPEILMAEGYATGASLHMATGKPVAVAFDAGNLKSVAIQLREKFPQAKITICADNDHKANKNVGLEKALDAAQAVQAGWSFLISPMRKRSAASPTSTIFIKRGGLKPLPPS